MVPGGSSVVLVPELMVGPSPPLWLQITSAADSEAVTRQKLVKGHAYSLTGAAEVRWGGGVRRGVNMEGVQTPSAPPRSATGASRRNWCA